MIGTFVHPRGEDRWRDCIRFYHRSLSTDVNTTRFSSNWTESNDLIEILLKRNTYTQPSFPPTSLSLHPVSSQRCDLSRHLSRVSRVTVSRVGEKELEFAEEIFHTRERKKFRLFSGEKKDRRGGTRCFHSRLCVCVDELHEEYRIHYLLSLLLASYQTQPPPPLPTTRSTRGKDFRAFCSMREQRRRVSEPR